MKNIKDILQRIYLIKKTRLNERASKVAQLEHDIQTDFAHEGLSSLVSDALIGLKLKMSEHVDKIELEVFDRANEYEGAFNIDLYQNILPLSQLAYALEKNGVPEEHAFKLATIFENEQQALNYLIKFANEDPGANPVHDACLFDIPMLASCNFKLWQKLARTYLNNPRFRDIFPHAGALERLRITIQEQIKAEANLRRDKTAINKDILATKESLSKTNQAFKLLKSQSGSVVIEEEKEELKNTLSALNTEKTTLRAKLAKLTAFLPLETADMPVLQALYSCYLQQSSVSHNFLISHGLSESNIAVFNALVPQNDDQAIPNITLDGKDIGYDGYYIKKLDVMSPEGAALAACLGKITNCCQYIGGSGSDCCIHGITSPNGGFYILCEGNAQNPLMTDPVVAQSWVWRSQNDVLCLDSIEANPKKEGNIKCIQEMYRLLAQKLCHEHAIPYITTGAQSGITPKISLKNYPSPKEHFKDYRGYCDSKSQLLLAKQNMPCLFYDNKDSTPFQEIIKGNVNVFFEQLLHMECPLKDNNLLKEVIAFALYKESNDLIQLLRRYASQLQRTVELESLILANQQFFESLNARVIMFDLHAQGAFVNTMNAAGESALHIAALNGDEHVINKLIEAGINLNIQDKFGNTALLTVLEIMLYQKKDERGRAIAKQLIKAGADGDIKDKDENTPLLIAVTHQDAEMVEYLIQQGTDIETFNAYMKTAIYLAVEQGNEIIFDMLFALGANIDIVDLEKNHLFLAAVQKGNQSIVAKLLKQNSHFCRHKNKIGQSPLHLAAPNSELTNIILEGFSEKERLFLLMQKDNMGQTALYVFSKRTPESLQNLLSFCPKDKVFALLKLVNNKGETIIHQTANEPELQKVLFDLRSESEIITLIMQTDARNETVLHKSARGCKGLHGLLERCPQTTLIALLPLESIEGETPLHLAAPSYESLSTLVKFCPQDGIGVDLFMKKNRQGNTVFHSAAHNPKSLAALLTFCPETDGMIDRFLQENNQGETVLHKASSNPESLQILLAYWPKDKIIDALLKVDKQGRTVIHAATKNSLSLRCILSFFDVSERSGVIKQAEARAGYPVLKEAISPIVPDSIHFLLSLTPEPERLAMLSQPCYQNRILLHHVAFNAMWTLKDLLILLPKSDQFIALSLVSQGDKRTLLQLVAHCASTIKDILELFLDHERKKLIRQGDNNGENLLHINHENNHLEAFRTILSFFTIDEAVDALRQEDNQGNTVLHKVARDYYTLTLILNSFSRHNKRIDDIIRQVNKQGNTVLHEAARNSDTLKILLAYLPEAERLHDIKQINHNGKTILHCAVNNSESFVIVLSLYPEDKWPDALKQMDKFGNILLHDAAIHNPTIIKNVLARYPKKVSDDLLRVKNKKEQTILQYSLQLANRPHSVLKNILPLYRKHQHKVDAVEATDKKGRTVLHLVSGCKKSIKIILALYPNQEKQLEVIERLDGYGLTILHYSALQNKKTLKILLALYPNDERRFNAIMMRSQSGKTVLYYSAKSINRLSIVLTNIPESKRLAAIMQKDNEGKTLLNQVISNKQRLIFILQACPEKDRLAILRYRINNQSIEDIIVTSDVYTLPLGIQGSFVDSYLSYYKDLKLGASKRHSFFPSLSLDQLEQKFFAAIPFETNAPQECLLN